MKHANALRNKTKNNVSCYNQFLQWIRWSHLPITFRDKNFKHTLSEWNSKMEAVRVERGLMSDVEVQVMPKVCEAVKNLITLWVKVLRVEICVVLRRSVSRRNFGQLICGKLCICVWVNYKAMITNWERPFKIWLSEYIRV